MDRLLGDPSLQDAPRWRIEALLAVQAGDGETLRALARRCTPFQRWYLGVFLVEVERARPIGLACLASSEVDLSAMPALQVLQARIRDGQTLEEDALSRLAAY